LAAQTTGLPPTQFPFPSQVSVWVQALPSLQAVPLSAFGLEHCPVVASQGAAAWHWSSAVQTAGLIPSPRPSRQTATTVQALPSLHVVPSTNGVCAHWPVAESQAALWHWSLARQTTGVPGVHVPAPSQTSCPLQALPSSQATPADLFVWTQPVLGS